MFQIFVIVFSFTFGQAAVIVDQAHKFQTYDECMVTLAEKLNTPSLVEKHSQSEITSVMGLGCVKAEDDTAV